MLASRVSSSCCVKEGISCVGAVACVGVLMVKTAVSWHGHGLRAERQVGQGSEASGQSGESRVVAAGKVFWRLACCSASGAIEELF